MDSRAISPFSSSNSRGKLINGLIEDTNECSRKIQMITGEAPALYCAPYGEYDNVSVSTVEGVVLQYVQWSAEPLDRDGKHPEGR